MRVTVCAVVLLAGCATSAGVPPDPDALMEADRAFARATAEHGGEGWAASFATDGVMFPDAGKVEGREAILARMVPAFADSTRRLSWEPTSAVVAGSGDLGYTIGRWTASRQDSGGTWRDLATGNYVTVWRRQDDGTWKVALDIGNDDPPPQNGASPNAPNGG